MTEEKNQEKAYAFAALAIFFWSTVASVFKISLRYLHFIELLWISTLVSSACLFSILVFQKKVHLLKSLEKRDYRNSFLLGLLNPFLYYMILFKAYSLLPAQMAQPLNMTWGIVIAVLSIPILKQRIKMKSIVAILISFSGVLVISTGGQVSQLEFKNPLGIGLALGSSIMWSLYWLMNVKDRLEPVLRLFLNFFFGFIFTSLYILVYHPPRIPPAAGIMGAVYVGMFEMGLTFYFWIRALKLTETTDRVSILIYIAPFVSLIFIHFFVGEKILWSSVAGLIFIVGGILVQQLGNPKKV